MSHFNFFVLGAGSGGIAAARRAASYGASVGVAEGKALGGTCVNVGCVPKKIMWWGSTVYEMARKELQHYGVSASDVKFDWTKLKERRDASILRLNGIYRSNLAKDNIRIYENAAKFLERTVTGKIALKVGSETVTADHVLIAVGGRPEKLGVPGDDFVGTSDDFFEWSSLPRKVAVVGAGYIAVELAGMLRGLGSEVHCFIRGKTPIRHFDAMLGEKLKLSMEKQGVIFHTEWITDQVQRRGKDDLVMLSKNGHCVEGFDRILSAVGRTPEVENSNLKAVNVKTLLDEPSSKMTPPKGPKPPSHRPYIVTDEYQNTTSPNIYALGDVCGIVELTPMAIAAGRRLADRLFGGRQNAKADYEDVPTVIFSHPPIGTIGMSEKTAKEIYGADNVKVYSSVSVNLYYNVFNVEPAEKPKIHIKLVCLKPMEKIIGLHIIGMGADEMLQGFGVAIKMGATKADFDKCVAIHPSASEEVVTLAPWGLAP